MFPRTRTVCYSVFLPFLPSRTYMNLEQGFEAQSAIVDHLQAQCPKLDQGFEAHFGIDHLSSCKSWNRWWRQRIWGKFEAIESVIFCWIILPLMYGWIFMSLYFLIYLWQVTLLYPVALPILHCRDGSTCM